MGNPVRPIPEFIGFKYFWNPNIPSLVSQHKSTLPKAFYLAQVSHYDNMPLRSCPRHAQRAGGWVSWVYPVQVLRIILLRVNLLSAWKITHGASKLRIKGYTSSGRQTETLKLSGTNAVNIFLP